MTDPKPVHPGTENLIPANERTEAELKEMTRNGGIKSGEVRRERKRMADIYAMVLAKKYKVLDADGKEVQITGHDKIAAVIEHIVEREDSASVSMIKEMREGLDGSKIGLMGADGAPVVFKIEIVPKKKEGES